jgi:hypothetical protein
MIARLHPADLDQLAERVAEHLAERMADVAATANQDNGLVDATTVADALNISRGMVYANAAELGGRRLSDSPRARLRFDLAEAKAAWKRRDHEPTPAPERRQPRREPQPGPSRSAVELLPIRGPRVPR